MPRYQIGGELFRRKNLYLPCVIVGRADEMTEAELARVYRENAWADNITEGEWLVVLEREDAKPYARSRLKRKAAGWLVAFARIADLQPDLAAQIVTQAAEVYRRGPGDGQETGWLLPTLCNAVGMLQKAGPGDALHSEVWVEPAAPGAEDGKP
ncbi:MAG: hypothetical protein ACXVS6_22710 [Solirubrobacteraceae bacterium]